MVCPCASCASVGFFLYPPPHLWPESGPHLVYKSLCFCLLKQHLLCHQLLADECGEQILSSNLIYGLLGMRKSKGNHLRASYLLMIDETGLVLGDPKVAVKVWQCPFSGNCPLTERCALWNRIPGEVRLVHRGQALWTCFYDSSWARHDGVPNIWILSCVVPYICRFPAGLGIVTTIQMKAWKTKQLNPSTFSSEHLCKTLINDSLSFKKVLSH